MLLIMHVLAQLVSWLPMHAASKAILDVAFTKEQPAIALNIVHPRPVDWLTIMRDVSDALLATKVTSKALPLVPFGEWFEALEERAKIGDAHDLNNIVSTHLQSTDSISDCFGFLAGHQTSQILPCAFIG
jgi:hypothetical protein